MFGCISAKKYQPQEELPPVAAAPGVMEWRHIPEPQLTELTSYMRQRRDFIIYYMTIPDVRAEVTRNVTEQVQPVDQYPRGRHFLNDDEYMLVLKDLLNLSNILDDMEQNGVVPYNSRSAYYNLYCKLYRMLVTKAKSAA